MKFVLLLALLAASHVHAQIAFKGVPLGGDRYELQNKFPSVQCKALPPSKWNDKGDEFCRDDYCPAGGSVACDASRTVLRTYGGQPVNGIGFGVIGGRVESFEASIPWTSYNGIRDALREVHGQGTEGVMTLATGGGRLVESRVWKATTADGSMITVYERSSSLTDGLVVGRTAAGEAYAVQVNTPKKDAKDL